MDYAHLLRQAAARAQADPTLLEGDEAKRIVVEWLIRGAEGIEDGDQTRRAIEDPEGAPGIKLARLLAKELRP